MTLSKAFGAVQPLVASASLVLLAACETIVAVEPGSFEPNKSFSVDVGKTWTAYPPAARTQSRTLTVDGTLLNSLVFSDSIGDGGSLLPVARGDKERLIPTFRADMTEFEIAEFISDSLAVAGFVNVTTENLRPDMFDQLEGLRLDFTGAQASGLEFKGTAKAAVQDDRLLLILYYAPAEYYYGLHAEEVERIMQSASLTAAD